MADNILVDSFQNPIKFVDKDPVLDPMYLTKHFDEWRFKDQLKDFPEIQAVDFCQIWQTSDKVRFQYQSNYDPIDITIYTEKGKPLQTIRLQNIVANKYLPGYYVYEGEFSLATIPEGCYFFQRNAGSGLRISVSEPFCIAVMHKKSVLIKYKNTTFHEDIIFETGMEFMFRTRGAVLFEEPGSQRFAFNDQKLNPTVLSAKPFDIYRFGVGDQNGNPGWVVKRMNRIFSCDTISLDNKLFSALEDFKIEQKSEDGTWMKGVSMLLREGLNRSSVITTDQPDTNKRLLVTFNIESKLFGDVSGNGSNNTTPIKATE